MTSRRRVLVSNGARQAENTLFSPLRNQCSRIAGTTVNRPISRRVRRNDFANTAPVLLVPLTYIPMQNGFIFFFVPISYNTVKCEKRRYIYMRINSCKGQRWTHTSLVCNSFVSVHLIHIKIVLYSPCYCLKFHLFSILVRRQVRFPRCGVDGNGMAVTQDDLYLLCIRTAETR